MTLSITLGLIGNYVFGLILTIKLMKYSFGYVTYSELCLIILIASLWPVILLCVLLDKYGNKKIF